MNKAYLSALLRKARRDRAKYDIEFFANYYLGHYLQNKTPAFHQEIRRLLLTENRLCIAAPRGFAKSTNLQVIYALHCLLFNEGEDILTISMSANLAEDWVRKLKFELEGNEQIKTDFGSLLGWGEKESKRWTATHLVIQTQGRIFSQIRARGRGCQVRGLRPTKVFADDLEDDELVRSEEQRKILKEWFLSALLNVLKIDQQLVVMGTILHPLALLNDIIKKKEQFGGWTVRKYKAITDEGNSLWHDRFPMKDLLRRKFEIGTYAFESEFQNNPISSDICLWRAHWIKTYDKPPEIKHCFVALDPAASIKESADYSGLVCIGIGVDDKIYELESIKGRWGTWDLIDRCISFNKRWRPVRFGIETMAFQSFIKPVLLKEAKKQGIFLPIESITLGSYTGKEKTRKSPKDKYTRALSVIHLFEQDLVRLKTPDLIEELSLFPTGSHDDLVDACVWCLKMIMRHSPVKVTAKEEQREKIKGFEIRNSQIPCIDQKSIFNNIVGSSKDWRTGG